jgi:hypothetical protein
MLCFWKFYIFCKKITTKSFIAPSTITNLLLPFTFSYKTLVTKTPEFPTKNLPGSQTTVISKPNKHSNIDCAYSFVQF